MDEELRKRRVLDFFFGLGTIGLGVFVFLEGMKAFRDPLLAIVRVSTNPGTTTSFVGALLAILGLSLTGLGYVGTGKRPFALARQILPAGLRNPRLLKGLIVLALLALYFFVLWRNLPFWLSTGLFLALTMAVFRAGAWWKILLVAAVTTAVVYYVFGRLAFVPLPDTFFWDAAARGPRH